MIIDDQIRDEKLQYGINREAAEISALSSNKFNRHEYLTGEEILASNQKQMIKQAKFTCSLLGKAFEKQIKTIEDRGWGGRGGWGVVGVGEQVKSLEDLKSKSI